MTVMVIGWDIGGVNTKVARIETGTVREVRGRPYELQRAPHQLVHVLHALAAEVGAVPDSWSRNQGSGFPCAVTMTAELSQLFRSKRDGVSFVLDAVESAFPFSPTHVFATDGRFVAPETARQTPLIVAAANWAATARIVADDHPDAVLIDIGTTSTDIIPIVAGEVRAEGRTDPDRLASGELVYSGALRTPAEAMASTAPLRHRTAFVSAEGFALAGDVHVWRGDLDPADYTVATPDGRPATREFAGERLARVICADREMLDVAAISAIAEALAAAQVARIAGAIARVRARHPPIRTAVITGLGAFIGARAAHAAGLQVVPLAREIGDAAARCAPAACVALLLERALASASSITTRRGSDPQPGFGRPPGSRREEPERHPGASARWGADTSVETVVKLGGGILAHADHFDESLEVISNAARTRPLLVVPGGGPFADTVREVDRRLGLADAVAHWMAVLAMDQYAHLVASRLAGGVVVASLVEIQWALREGRLPVLAPSRWLREADPLPHSWDVTSDSIAAWVAGAVGAPELVLIKPAHASGALVDPYFSRALPAHVSATIVPADRLEAFPVPRHSHRSTSGDHC